MAMTLGHQLVAVDSSAKFEPNNMVVERKRTTTYRTEAMTTTGSRGKEKMKKKEPDNIPATAKSPPTETEETDYEQCGFDIKKKIRMKENHFLYHSIRILKGLYMR